LPFSRAEKKKTYRQLFSFFVLKSCFVFSLFLKKEKQKVDFFGKKKRWE